MPVLISPLSDSMPTAPPYQPRALFSRLSIATAAAFFGAPINVTAHIWLRNASSESNPPQKTFHMIHRMEKPRVCFDQPAADHLHRPRFADAALVVAIHIGAHRQLRLFFRRTEQLADILLVLQRIARAPRRSRDRARFHARAFHAHEHLRRRPHQLLIAELNQESYGLGFARCIRENNSDALPE